MKKRLLTLLAVLAVLVGALSIVGFAAESTVDTLSADQSEYIVSSDMTLDLAGKNITNLVVNAGVKLVLNDSVGDGEITNITGGGIVELAKGYMNFAGGNKLTLTNAGTILRTDNIEKDGTCIYFASNFGGNETVKGKIVAYGVAMYLRSAENLFADNTFTRNDDLSGWKTNAIFTNNSVLLKGILKANNAYSVNKANANMKVYNAPYVEMEDGTRIVGSTANRSLKNVVEGVTAATNPGSDYWDSYSDTQKTNVINMCKTFKYCMTSWDLGRIDPLMKTTTDNVYYIYDAFDAKQVSSVSGADVQLKASVDLEGQTIDGLTNFTGSFYGNGYTMSNFTVNGVGLVDQVASGEKVSNLHLRDVNVVVPADATATAVGLIAGTNNGTVSGVSATGSVKDTRENVKMGALVGNNAGAVSATANITVTNTVNTLKTNGSGVGTNNTSYTTTDLVAAVGLYNDAENVKRGIVGGGNAIANADTVYWRDSSYSTERQTQVLQNRRQTVVDDVYAQGTIKWTVPSTITYYNDQKNQSSFNKGDREWVQTGKYPWQGSWVGTYHIHNQKFTPGTTYSGIPYTHTSSTIEQAKFYMTEGSNGVYTLKSEIASLTGGSNSAAGNATWSNGGLGWAQYLGSDCSAALTVAWHKVSPIRDLNRTESNKGVSPFYTSNIVPSEFNQWCYGLVKVGDYTVDDAALAATYELTGTAFTTNDKKQTKTNYGINTDMIVADIIENQGGIQTVYETYAKTQMGDIMASSGTAGHTRMAAIDPVVIRNGKGVIDPAKSYFVTHEQGDGLYERATTNSSWRINYKYTFEQLAYQNTEDLTGSSGYYLPVTMHAFHDASVGTASSAITLNGGRKYDADEKSDPSYVVINGSFRIQNATMTIMDAPDGNVLYQKTAYQGASSNQNRRRAVPGNVPMYMSEFFSDYGTNLTAGQTYYFTLSGTTFVSTAPNNVYTNQAFVYTPAE